MNRKIAALRVLCERSTAKQFANVTKGMTVAQTSLHLQSVLAAALINPHFVMAGIVKAMAFQVGKARGATRPVLLTVPCIGREERETFRRLVLALTLQVAALIEGPDMPDASTVVRALISEWLSVTTLGQHTDPMSIAGHKRGLPRKKKRETRTPKRRNKPRTKRPTRPPRKKSAKKTAKADQSLPHPDFPDVSVKPIDWRPGRRGRPPRGAKRRKDGSWTIPNGFRVIKGKVHAPLPAQDRPKQKRAHLPKLRKRMRQTHSEIAPVVAEPEAAEPSTSHNEPQRILHDEGDERPGEANAADAPPDLRDEDQRA